MIEKKGNIWEHHAAGGWVAIPTNGCVRRDGSAVMGAGVALQAARKFPGLAAELGQRIRAHGNIPFAFPHCGNPEEGGEQWQPKEKKGSS